MMKVLSFALALLLLLSGTACAESLPQEDYYGRYMAATTEEERQAVLDEMPDTRYAAYDAESGKWGLIDRVGRWVVEPGWDWLHTFAHGDYAIVGTIADEEILDYSIIDRDGNTVAVINGISSEFFFSDISDSLLVAEWDDDRILLFSASVGRFLNDRGYIYGNAEEGYRVSLLYNAYENDLPDLCYFLSPEGERIGEGLWMDPGLFPIQAIPADDPDAVPMRLVYWDDAQWEYLLTEYPYWVNNFCDGDISFAETRQDSYHLLDEAGNVVFSSENFDDFLVVSATSTDASLFSPSEEGLRWEDNSAGTLSLKNEAGNVFYSMEYEEPFTDSDHALLLPQENTFLVWDDDGLYGYLRGDGSILWPPCFEDAGLFVDGLAKVSWFSDDWSEEELELYTLCEDGGPYHAELSPSSRCFAYIDAFGNVVFSSFGIYHLP